MNRFFDFTSKQLQCLFGLTILLVIFGGLIFIKSYTVVTSPPPSLQVHFGENNQTYTGLFVIDPNRSPADSLELLPGIGTVLADRIVEYRRHHRFEREIDITEVKGIGPKLFEQLRPYLKVSRP